VPSSQESLDSTKRSTSEKRFLSGAHSTEQPQVHDAIGSFCSNCGRSLFLNGTESVFTAKEIVDKGFTIQMSETSLLESKLTINTMPEIQEMHYDFSKIRDSQLICQNMTNRRRSKSFPIPMANRHE